jgi:hypothetical protein
VPARPLPTPSSRCPSAAVARSTCVGRNRVAQRALSLPTAWQRIGPDRSLDVPVHGKGHHRSAPTRRGPRGRLNDVADPSHLHRGGSIAQPVQGRSRTRGAAASAHPVPLHIPPHLGGRQEALETGNGCTGASRDRCHPGCVPPTAARRGACGPSPIAAEPATGATAFPGGLPSAAARTGAVLDRLPRKLPVRARLHPCAHTCRRLPGRACALAFPSTRH